MEEVSKVEAAAQNLDVKRARDELHEKEEAATDEQPRKRAKREDQAKCSKCNKRLARRGMFVFLFGLNTLPAFILLTLSFSLYHLFDSLFPSSLYLVLFRCCLRRTQGGS